MTLMVDTSSIALDDYLHLLEYATHAGAVAVTQSTMTTPCSICSGVVRIVSVKIPTLYNPRFQWRDLVPEIHRRACFVEHTRLRAARAAARGPVDLWA